MSLAGLVLGGLAASVVGFLIILVATFLGQLLALYVLLRVVKRQVSGIAQAANQSASGPDE